MATKKTTTTRPRATKGEKVQTTVEPIPPPPEPQADPVRDAKVFGGPDRINPAIDPSKTAEERLAALDKQHRIMRGG